MDASLNWPFAGCQGETWQKEGEIPKIAEKV